MGDGFHGSRDSRPAAAAGNEARPTRGILSRVLAIVTEGRRGNHCGCLASVGRGLWTLPWHFRVQEPCPVRHCGPSPVFSRGSGSTMLVSKLTSPKLCCTVPWVWGMPCEAWHAEQGCAAPRRAACAGSWTIGEDDRPLVAAVAERVGRGRFVGEVGHFVAGEQQGRDVRPWGPLGPEPPAFFDVSEAWQSTQPMRDVVV